MPAGRALVERLGLTFPLLSDPKAAMIGAFGVLDGENEVSWPAIFIVDRNRTIVKRWLADTYSQRIATMDVIADLPPAP